MRLVSLNVERSAHLHRFVPFLATQAPDVACLQELCAGDIDTIRAATGLEHCHFVAMGRITAADEGPFGIGILSRHALRDAGTIVYAGGGDGEMVADRRSEESRVATLRYAVARARIAAGGLEAMIATTHFPWTDGGRASDFQDRAVDRLLNAMGHEPVVFCGDFNAPRGGPVFDRLARHWSDQVPPGVTTSIDPLLHRAGALQFMVDGLFTTPEFTAGDVQLHSGVSDHQALTATLRRSSQPE